MDNMIFYYSGTGNSLYDAISIGKSLKNVKLISMRHVDNNKMKISSCETIGFVFPVHHWGMPETVRNYIKKLKIGKASYVYAVVTFNKWEANCIAELAKLLKEKGCELHYASLHKNVNSNITSIFQNTYNISQNVKAENELEQIISDIMLQKKNRIPDRNIVKEWGRRLVYGRMTKFRMPDHSFFINSRCDSCGLCKEICGLRNITLKDTKPVFLHKCDHCLACIQYCPKQAIDYGRITKERKRYHHPFVSSARIAKKELLLIDGNIVEQ